MTGLDVEKEVIIETAGIITDLQFNELETYHAVVKQPQKYLDAMDDWNQNQHKKSGLVDLIPTGKAPEVVESQLCDFVDKHFKDEKAILAGNSISQDRLFINKYFKKLAERLHYRLLDVTAFKVVFNGIYNKEFEKEDTDHRALGDIKQSIAELKFYLQHVKA